MKKKIALLFPFFLLSLYSCKEQVNIEPVTITTQESVVQNTELKVSHKTTQERKSEADELREIYSKSSNEWPKPNIDYDNGGTFVEIGRVKPVIFPANNPYSVAKAEVGKALFFDKRLSGSNALSCSTCHDPNKSWAEDKDLPNGHNGIQLKRNSPSIINNAYNTIFFWDGRAATLEDQAVAVMTNPNEIHATPESIEKTFNEIPYYKTKFKEAFGIDKITINEVSKAITTFERTVVTKNQSHFDQFLGGNKSAMSDSEIRGMNLFRTRGKCINCHNGANFTDNKFHNLSLTYEGSDKEDLGRYNITKLEDDWGRFKTPSLRNVSKTGPYMHNGVFLTVKKVLSLYNDGMHGKDPHKSPIIKPLGFSDEEMVDLEEFLNSLSEPVTVK